MKANHPAHREALPKTAVFRLRPEDALHCNLAGGVSGGLGEDDFGYTRGTCLGMGHCRVSLVRLIGVGIGLGAASRVDLLSTTRVSLRAWPEHFDLNFHVNNGRYLRSPTSVAFSLVRAHRGARRRETAPGLPGRGRCARQVPTRPQGIRKLRDSHALDRLESKVGLSRASLRAARSRDRARRRSRHVQGAGPAPSIRASCYRSLRTRRRRRSCPRGQMSFSKAASC